VSEQIDAFLLNRSRQKPATEATEQENFCVRPRRYLSFSAFKSLTLIGGLVLGSYLDARSLGEVTEGLHGLALSKLSFRQIDAHLDPIGGTRERLHDRPVS
jgi:hypothetical protein